MMHKASAFGTGLLLKTDTARILQPRLDRTGRSLQQAVLRQPAGRAVRGVKPAMSWANAKPLQAVPVYCQRCRAPGIVRPGVQSSWSMNDDTKGTGQGRDSGNGCQTLRDTLRSARGGLVWEKRDLQTDAGKRSHLVARYDRSPSGISSSCLSRHLNGILSAAKATCDLQLWRHNV